MAHIYIYSPSGAVADRTAFKRGVRRLEKMGHAVELDPSVLARDTRFAGDDATRLQSIERAAASGADVALVTRGGYGLTRLLPALPYQAITDAIERGTRFVGLSDFTALQLALLARTGARTWSGPAVCEGFGTPDEPDEIMQACFDDLLQGLSEGAGWRLPAPDFKANPAWLADGGWEISGACLWGGNLTVLTALLGTPYFPQVDGGVLFVEDVNEHPYRIERMLNQLLQAGVLAQQKAIVLGQFTAFKPSPLDKGYKLATVVEWLRAQVSVPVLTGLPFGHVPTKVLLPVGTPVDLTLQGREAIIYWD